MARSNKAARRSKAKQKYEDEKIIELEAARNNIKAQKEGPKKKSWSVLDIKSIKPLTESQRMLMESYFLGNHVVAAGTAGTGKSFLAMYMALISVFSKDYSQKKIIIVRSNVTTGKDLGALPGEIHEKMAPFEAPYRDIVTNLTGKPHSYDDMKESGKIEFFPTSFVRGNSWDDAVIIVDEVQNMSDMEIHSVMTRVGNNSKLIVCGDRAQNDLIYERKLASGFDNMLRIFDLMPEVDVVHFTRADIVRSGFVKSWIIAKEDLNL